MSNPRVSILLRDGRKINCELYPEIAPISVKNFLDLVEKKVLWWTYFSPSDW